MNKMWKTGFIIISLFSITFVFGEVVYFPSEEWRVSTPEEQGLSSDKLEEMITFIEDNYLQIDGVVLIRNGYLVFERYPSPDYDEDTLHLLYSVTKSVTSSLIGIALDQGIIPDTSKTMVSFFPDREIQGVNEWKSKVTLEHLLMMKSGMKWDESSAGFDTPQNDIYHINHGDGLQYCLDLPMVAEPGTLWHYNTGSSHIMSGIIHETSGLSTLEFAQKNLFEPIGITNVEWYKDLGGTNKGGFDLALTPRDMARFGYLYLHEGRWGDTQVVSKEWVELSTSTLTRLNTETGYGYQWWTMPQINAYRASGLYGQQIFVAPDEEIVFVLTGHISPSQHELEETFFENYVLASIIKENQPTANNIDEKRIHSFPMMALITGLMLSIALLKRKKELGFN